MRCLQEDVKTMVKDPALYVHKRLRDKTYALGLSEMLSSYVSIKCHSYPKSYKTKIFLTNSKKSAWANKKTAEQILEIVSSHCISWKYPSGEDVIRFVCPKKKDWN